MKANEAKRLKELVLDGVRVVQIDTTETVGRVRVVIYDGTVYDGNPRRTLHLARITAVRAGTTVAGCGVCGA